jgi:hypothetical protein
MEDRLQHIGIWAAFAVTATIMLINALYMLISPKAWWELPKWLGLQGVMTKERYGNRRGALQVRALGAMIIATCGWIAINVIPTIGRR